MKQVGPYQGDVEDKPSGVPPRDLQVAPLRLFLVEDSQAVREFIVSNVANIHGLQLIGFAETEDDAVVQLSEKTCDLLILDIELKQGNGMSLLRTIAKQDLQPHMLKVIFSNNVSGIYRRIGLRYGVQFFFDKTSEFLPLLALLRQMAMLADKS